MFITTYPRGAGAEVEVGGELADRRAEIFLRRFSQKVKGGEHHHDEEHGGEPIPALRVDVKGNRVDVTGDSVDVKGNSVGVYKK
eukprot:4155688-Pyramimonas_sp.AAC.1